MDDRVAVAIALAVAAAALAAVDGHLGPVPLAAGPVVVLAAAAMVRGPEAVRTALLGLGAALLAAALGQRSVAGLDAPLDTGPVRAEVTLVGDPAPDRTGGVSVDVRLDGRRYRAVARSAAAAALDERLAGERVTVIGSIQRPSRYERMLRHRHIAGRIVVDTVTGWRPGDPASAAANGFRRTLAAGAEPLGERHGSLLAGLTLGDDRHQPADMVEAFRASGLSHLLAVSGQNVAFVLVIAGPVLTRLRFGPRLAATLAVLAAFALVTRAEPSVLRAVAMAGVAALGAALGRPASTVRALALGATGMVLVDPLLTTSLGFRLSVLGAAGIVVGAEPIERALPGPRWLAAPLAVTLAAQAAVAPLLVATFGGVPVASLPANLLAAPAAGSIMVWGLTGGLVAGLAGGVVAEVLHLPTRVLLAWLDGVARTAAGWPGAELRMSHLAALGVAAALVAAGRHGRPGGAGTGWARAGWTIVVATALVAVAPGRGPPADLAAAPLGSGATVWSSGAAVVLVVDGRADGDRVVADLRARRLRGVGVLVVRTGSPAAAEAAERIGRATRAGLVLVPRRSAAEHVVPGAQVPARGAAFDLGRLRVGVVANDDTLEVEVRARGPPSRRGAEPCPTGLRRAPILGARAPPDVSGPCRRHEPGAPRRSGRPAGTGAGGRGRPGPEVRA